ncbi:MobA/MobL family protein [Celeribacter sp. HF31]|nr:MobA/MobL family protein [Celeribacter sp. HF31]NIY80369.1 MobA/MobL family protein [Celeribacter sp. HF31]
MTKKQAGFIAAIHDQTDNDAKNPHAHVVLFDKYIKTGGRGRPKSIIGMARKSAVENAARDWATVHNRLMTAWGYPPSSMIDHRSFLERGIDKIPTIHEGPGSRATLSAKHTIQPKAAWHNIDQGHSRTEANEIIKEINASKEALNAQERTDRLASCDGGNGNGRHSGFEKHRANDQRRGTASKHTEPPFLRDQGSQACIAPNRSGSTEAGKQPRRTPHTISNVPCAQLANNCSSLRSRKPIRRIFLELIMLRDILKMRLNYSTFGVRSVKQNLHANSARSPHLGKGHKTNDIDLDPRF